MLSEELFIQVPCTDNSTETVRNPIVIIVMSQMHKYIFAFYLLLLEGQRATFRRMENLSEQTGILLASLIAGLPVILTSYKGFLIFCDWSVLLSWQDDPKSHVEGGKVL